MKHLESSQRGAVSIFIVVFTALLVTIVTTSFIQIMLRNQDQATNNDLSQSAYDSALAGVEDAKRALVTLKKCQSDSAPTVCTGIESELNSGDCDSLDQAGIVTFNPSGEVPVGSANSNQAYSCVKIDVTTESVQGSLTEEGTKVIPLDSEGSDDDITAVEISWFTSDDLPCIPVDPLDLSLGCTPGSPSFTGINPPLLPPVTSWPENGPPIMRAQLIQFERQGLRLSEFDQTDTNKAKTRFLYPYPGGSTTADFNDDDRRDVARNNPVITNCANDFTSVTYLCSTRITLPDQTNREAYLQLATFYGGAHYQVRLIGDDPGEVLDFDGVQPEVDSTGRASDLFRRVKARVSVSIGGTPVQFPNAALSVGKSLCKDFFITNEAADFNPDTDTIVCDPAN
ncbi:MAG TPA: hypothetical protein PK096_02125 [Candidatus Saccharibacteria bacterium]|nr:hypothetical protein [Candidatus Saccharibacteria bacterium]HRK94145.1 hypothetical protein [Candidatus Saccharibacteria bacterium]